MLGREAEGRICFPGRPPSSEKSAFFATTDKGREGVPHYKGSRNDCEELVVWEFLY